MTVSADCIPIELRTLPNWVCWRWAMRDGKYTKPPVDPHTGGDGSSTNPATWTTFDRARDYCDQAKLPGVGFVVRREDRITGVDLDKCLDPETGIIARWAREIVNALDSYTEITPSGKGLRVYVRGNLPGRRRRRGHVELYDDRRFFTVTGAHLEGTPDTIEERQAELDALCERIFGSEQSHEKGNGRAGDPLEPDDEVLIKRASMAANGAKFSRLWAGEWKGDYESQSNADLALCMMLAFWSGHDPSRIDRLFRKSGLFRGKWDSKRGDSTYGAWTVDEACRQQTDTYGARQEKSSAEPEPEPEEPPIGDPEPEPEQKERQPYIEFAPTFLSTEDPPRKYLIEDLIPEESLIVQHGDPRTKKSWAAVEQIIALATGTCAFGLERFAVKTSIPVLYSSQEDSARDVRIRARALLRGRGIERYPDTLAFAIHKGINLDSFEWQEALIKDAIKYGFRFIALDPIRRYSPNADKGPGEVRVITGFLRRFSVETGATIDITHHDVKPERNNRDDRRRSHRASGGDWFAAADCPIAFEIVSHDTTLVVPEDYKFSVDPQPFKFRLETDDPRTPTWARLVGDSTTTEDAKMLALFFRIKSYLTEHSAGASGSAIARAIKTRKEDVLAALDSLLKNGEVDCVGGGVNGKKQVWFLRTDEKK
jgi:hypothetical protein